MVNNLLSVLKGFILGLIIVLPGMSGGTVFVILGMYENMIKDIVRFNIKPYIPLLLGIAGGIYIGGNIFTVFFLSHRDITAALLLGALLASVRAVIDVKQRPHIKHLLILFFGVVFGYFTAGESISMFPSKIEANPWLLFIGGAFSSAAMIIPGIPGSSVLFILSIYDTMLLSIKELHISNLLFFGVGSIGGILLLANMLEKIYDKHRDLLSYLFAGLIIGSSRTLLPYDINTAIVLAFSLAFVVVWRLSKSTLAAQ
ncbi:undecaprenyl phosphate translocase family protein [Anaerosolibacter sp.]|uniref:undecaprenyl phosphate translocase family protein n=1 Tax=Anaerosolibacter sp. TaxID=1872527 RepID=UPI0039EE4181